jgi:hypothetical protein
MNGIFLTLALSLAAHADQAGCIAKMRDGFIKGVQARINGTNHNCSLSCAAYKATYCTGGPATATDIDEMILKKFKDLEAQQDALLKPNAVLKDGEINSSTVQTHALEIQETAKKRVAGLLFTQANDVEDGILKPILMKSAREWHYRFTHLQESLEFTLKYHPELKKNPCQDQAGIVAGKDAILDALEDEVRAVHGGQRCLEKEAEKLKGEEED